MQSRASKVVHQNVNNVLFVEGLTFHFILAFSVIFEFLDRDNVLFFYKPKIGGIFKPSYFNFFFFLI